MKNRGFRSCLPGLIAVAAWAASPVYVTAQSISGSIYNSSVWTETVAGPPGDGNRSGELRVGLFSTTNSLFGPPLRMAVVTNGTLPFLYGPYDFTLGPTLGDGPYTVLAWVDGDTDGRYDIGEPSGQAAVTVVASNSITGVAITPGDDSNENGLPDWWEYHWFRFTPNPFGQVGGGDPDGDGLSNEEEARIGSLIPGLSTLAPNNWDTDGDDMDDRWEYEHDGLVPTETIYVGMDPCQYNKTNDFDGDGLSDWQEYCGVDGVPRMRFQQEINGIRTGRLNPQPPDDLNPLDVDTDFDMLIDSFEAAWYDPLGGIDPHNPVGSIPTTNVSSSIAQADPDQDGLSNYREQCLLLELRQASSNGSKWDWGDRVPFPQLVYYKDNGEAVRICTMDRPGAILDLGLKMDEAFCTGTNRSQLRNHEWTDPTEGTGYYYTDEDLVPGHDTDNDWLPDGWEVHFNLDPRDDGMNNETNGPFGDPDGDFLTNIDEFFGQDSELSTTRPYINGTGDETNPNEYNHRPDSTYTWRWSPANPLISLLTDPRVGTGISRDETLGGALPTTSIGSDSGTDTDDDGIMDADEIDPLSANTPVSSPVFSCDPFIPRAALIVSTNGILIPDPEPATTNGLAPAGQREDLQRRDWTIECQVKLAGTNLVGDLFDFQTMTGSRTVTVYRLSLSNNVPILMAHNERQRLVAIKANALPTNRWIHLAGVWNHANNSMGLYVGGVLFNAALNVGESFSSHLMYPATNKHPLALAYSPNGSFTNRLILDEVRIWGVARTATQLADFANRLVPQGNGDDVWLDGESPQYYGRADRVIVNGGSLFEGEPGVAMPNVCQSVNLANFWIDDGDAQFTPTHDVILMRDDSLVAGLPGTLIANVRWNDKDGDGVFSRDSLLAYYRFDDGGGTAEDFARHAKNGLIGATFEDCHYGDRGYALATNNFAWTTNSLVLNATGFLGGMNAAAPVRGVDQRGADDSDGDGMPDAWEMTHGLDAWDDGTHGESSVAVKDGPNGAKGDPDGDGLINLYEFWAGTNPHDAVTAGNTVPDTQGDRDGDGVVNITEQALASRPDRVDTDDDGSTDNEEQENGTSPADPTDRPTDYYPKSLAIVLGGSPNDYLELPTSVKQRLTDMTLEAWVNPATNAPGIVIRRTIENLSGGGYAMNYVMGLETNAGGSLSLYAGYVTPNGSPTGRSFIVRGGPVATGDWTHVAFSYSSLGATLTLYTNGVSCASTNTFSETPRVNGLGGECFVRIGEDLAGGVDEVRVWNRVRSATEIRTGMTNVLFGGNTAGLVHSFRFDDGQARTNGRAANTPGSSFNEFHLPGGLQDFMFSTDWNTQWAHAAVIHGIVSFTNGAIRSPPSLRVIIAPDAAKAAGAQWQLDSGAWQNSGDSLQGLTPGLHTVLFKSIAGWTEPPLEPITLSNDVAITLTRLYIQRSSISVTLGPQAALDANMRWQVDDSPLQVSGAIVQNLSSGLHSLSYTPLAGYVEPIVKSVELLPGETRVVVAQYSPIQGSISAILQPATGTQWRIAGGLPQNSGAVVTNLPLGPYTVEFTGPPEWEAPASIDVILSNQITVVVTGVFAQVTGLKVDLSPAEAMASGAQWRLAGQDYTNSGTFLRLAAGAYTVQFKAVEGWLTPGDLPATVLSQRTTLLGATYLRADILGGIVGTNAGQFDQPKGLALDALHRLYVADTFNDRIQRYDPYDRSWKVWGSFGTNVGQFKKPSGVAVDAQGNAYVADANNNRIQKLTVADEQWHVLPPGGYGQGLGRFVTPYDVAVDSRTNLYVADQDNDRVQKMDMHGVWSVALTNFTVANPPLVAPMGLMVDAADNLYVSDDGTQTNGKSRVQKFDSAGQFVSLLGGHLTSEGGLSRPGGMALGETNLYVADIDNSRVVARSAMVTTPWTPLLGSNVLSRPEDVAWDPRGFLYIADTLHSRILIVPITGGATNGAAQFVGLASVGTNNSFTLSWLARSNWFYAVQYADSLKMTTLWKSLTGGTNILGRGAVTHYTDRTVTGVTNRFYRIIAY